MALTKLVKRMSLTQLEETIKLVQELGTALYTTRREQNIYTGELLVPAYNNVIVHLLGISMALKMSPISGLVDLDTEFEVTPLLSTGKFGTLVADQTTFLNEIRKMSITTHETIQRLRKQRMALALKRFKKNAIDVHPVVNILTEVELIQLVSALFDWAKDIKREMQVIDVDDLTFTDAMQIFNSGLYEPFRKIERVVKELVAKHPEYDGDATTVYNLSAVLDSTMEAVVNESNWSRRGAIKQYDTMIDAIHKTAALLTNTRQQLRVARYNNN